jgi:transcriptional regulator with XRE-family HTH domain
MSFSPPDTTTFDEARHRLAERMKALRNVASMPQDQAASRAGIDRSTWNKIERRRQSDIKLETLMRIQYALGVDTLEGLFGETTGDLLAGRSRRLSRHAQSRRP